MTRDFLFNAPLGEADPDVQRLIDLEDRRQAEKLQMIPSESICPRPVREALDASLMNKYAEGYPLNRFSGRERHHDLDVERQLAWHRRYGDRRFYKGTEFMNMVEALAQKRCAELFASDAVPARKIFVNVQPLSGAPANNAVYSAFLQPGDALMGMDLSHGGHLTHGSPFNRSGKAYRVRAYVVDEKTGRIDFGGLREAALEHKPKIIVGGASAYPWTIDWPKLRAIADEVGALVLADISHVAGLVVAGLFPNPVGVADITMFTSHKTMIGPRGAVLISTDREIARRLNIGVFPGEQGGPHVNTIAAKAVSFAIAATPEFRELQKRIVENAKALADEFAALGIAPAYGGTDTHMVLIDLRTMTWPSGVTLTGDVASNILDLCGIVCNKNALPGDATGTRPSGVRFGAVCLAQRGMGPDEMRAIARLVHRVLVNIRTFTIHGALGRLCRGRIEWGVMKEVADEVRAISSRFPPFVETRAPSRTFEVVGERAPFFLEQACTASLRVGETKRVRFVGVGDATVRRDPDRFIVDGPPDVRAWLAAVSDGYVMLDPNDLFVKVHGPVAIRDSAIVLETPNTGPEIREDKVYTVGQKPHGGDGRAVFEWTEPKAKVKKTPLYDWHVEHGARMVPFAGHSMPVWYGSAKEEHALVRERAGLFDVGHMGVFEVAGEQACAFLDVVATNFVPKLEIGDAHYTYLLDVDGRPFDDLIVYRTGADRYMLVVNASNQDKNWAWLSAVNERRVVIDRANPGRTAPGPVELRNLKDPKHGDDCRLDLALQGRDALPVLTKLTGGDVASLPKFKHMPARVGDLDIRVSRTGYTGESIGYELFVHPARARELWERIIAEGVRAVGLAARDSTRTEAGYPLYGHELAGRHNLIPTEAGYGAFVKLHKPFFVGRQAVIDREATIERVVARFEVTDPNARAIRADDEVAGPKGQAIGWVTSCVAIGQRQVGMAYLDRRHAKLGREIAIRRKQETFAAKIVSRFAGF